MTPQRLRLSRAKGFRLPLGTRSVARPSKYGNPFMVWKNGPWWADPFDTHIAMLGYAVACKTRTQAQQIAADAYAEAISAHWHAVPTVEQIRADLAGLSLACWCEIGSPCHGDLLLSIANNGGNDA